MKIEFDIFYLPVQRELEVLCSKNIIHNFFCKLHFGFGGNRLPTLSKQVSFSEFIIDRYDGS
jgi:hypothetical protein